MMAAARDTFWADCAGKGFAAEHLKAAGIYPMPGNPGFDDDTSFLAQPIFPGPGPLGAATAGDDVWELPVAWFREMETRPVGELRYDFRLPKDVAKPALRRAAALAVKRCMYLEIFRSRRACAVSTLQSRWKVYMAFARHACAVGKDLRDLDFADLYSVVAGLNSVLRKTVPAIYGFLRWWQAASPALYCMFKPPPTLEALEPPGEHPGLDTASIREDGVADEDRRFQPLPDAFVAAAGEFCLSVLDELRPAVTSCLREVMAFRQAARNDQVVARALSSRSWPLGMRIESPRDLRKAAHLCQISAIFVTSLMLGPRWSEVSSLPLDAVRSKTIGDANYDLLVGWTLKFSQSSSGDLRDWPLSPRLAKYLREQREYIEVVEGSTFRHLWRSHKLLWGGGEPMRQIDTALSRFSSAYGFEALLGGSSCHHHRFRKTTARLIVLALQGGPIVLRRLFGHEHLAMTLRYILANDSILDELRQLAEEEQARAAAIYVDRRAELQGGGAEPLRAAISRITNSLELTVPRGKRDQAATTTADIVDVLADGPEGFPLKQILPGLVACFKPRDEAGVCCKVGELPNVARCDAGCGWHLIVPEFEQQARLNVEHALSSLAGSRPGSLAWVHYSRVVREKVRFFPTLATAFAAHPTFTEVIASHGGETG